MKVDIFCHIFQSKLKEAFIKLNPSLESHRQLQQNINQPALWDMDYRLRVMEKYGDLTNVLTIAEAPVDLFPPRDAAELSRIGNNEMAEVIAKNPDKFIAGVATVPLIDIDEALKETDRTIKELGFKGIQITTNVNGKPLDLPEFMPLYAKMAEYDLPIWLHPHRDNIFPDYLTEKASKYGINGLFGWPYETTVAMTRLIFAGVLDKYPNMKIITHHLGGMVPFFEQRIVSWFQLAARYALAGEKQFIENLPKPPIEYYRMFYNDTAVYGSTPACTCGYDFFGAEHVLFGTDFPFDAERGHRHLRETIRSIEEMDIPASDKKKIYEDNARKLLKL